MSIFKDAILPGLFGIALAVVGFSLLTWQYWVLFALAIAWRFWPEKSK